MQNPIDPMRVALPAIRKPSAKDGAEIWNLIRSCKPLDENSMYCNLLQSDHFADTCSLAELSQETVGWISAYVMPNDPETLFVWQVAVAEKARGRGLGALMLQSILQRPQCKTVTRLQTTITADNEASWALFRRFAKFQESQLDIQPYYTQALHFQQRHKTENLVTIPLSKRLALAA
ncbi:L-2,4-diaminobutyric acid acetyltransferase [Phaeobacter sp. CECT 5382]|uniref:diaminobutyrate acetyltransferase n=2 Tax=Rhodobacterales TaxID=204455 RepID=UPI0006DA91DE|nr:diaminobutyrate acetyltransferase [Phaeobacter sp. CECT 5382]CUH88618.1 L-2,4-diaminobutyric acid acetyltransferase [Phaeobacter sp. CECT 5382]